MTALAAVIFIVGSSLTTVYAAERRTLESTVEKKPRIMELERERKPELVKSMWKDMALAEEMKAVEMGVRRNVVGSGSRRKCGAGAYGRRKEGGSRGGRLF